MIKPDHLPVVCLLGVCVSFSNPAFAEHPFPSEMFGIKIAGQYEIGPGDDVGSLPVKQITSTRTTIIPWGFRKYFEPATVDPVFPYKAMQNDPAEAQFKTNSYIYAYPIIPETVTTPDQLREQVAGLSQWHVAIISWSDDKSSEADANAWARDMCATIAADIVQEPTMVPYNPDNPDDTATSYRCRFVSADMHTAIEVFSSRGTSVNFKLVDHGNRGEIVKRLMGVSGELPGPDA